jgi:glycosyltransferase involved in cell wall biosynthesis
MALVITLIGPSHPFRGGVAHHSTLLYHHLAARHEVSFYAFRRQYPAWLFPGQTDRDTSEQPLREPGVEPALDPLHPTTWLDAYRRIRRARPRLVIIPWWTSFWTPHFWTMARLIRRLPETKTLFICHNVIDHEARLFSRLCARLVLGQADHCLVHSHEDAARLRRLVASARVTRAFHPIYDFTRPGLPPAAEARARAGVDGETILFFGFVRPYKGLPDLLQAMPLILARRRVTLLVVGEFWGNRDAFADQVRQLGVEGAVRFIDRYVPNEEVGLYFSAADLVVLPYVSGTASGVVQMAYGLDKPVVATRVGALAEMVDDGVTGFLTTPGQPPELAQAILRFFAENRSREFIDNIQRRKHRFSWERLVDIIEDIAAEEVGRHPPRGDAVQARGTAAWGIRRSCP